jgi:tRNA(adenine34) deaminase
MRMLNYFINRAGRQLTAERRKELERAKSLLARRVARDRKKREAAVGQRRGTHRRRDPIPKKEGANS